VLRDWVLYYESTAGAVRWRPDCRMEPRLTPGEDCLEIHLLLVPSHNTWPHRNTIQSFFFFILFMRLAFRIWIWSLCWTAGFGVGTALLDERVPSLPPWTKRPLQGAHIDADTRLEGASCLFFFFFLSSLQIQCGHSFIFSVVQSLFLPFACSSVLISFGSVCCHPCFDRLPSRPPRAKTTNANS
jgi:hypothetical protein